MIQLKEKLVETLYTSLIKKEPVQKLRASHKSGIFPQRNQGNHKRSELETKFGL